MRRETSITYETVRGLVDRFGTAATTIALNQVFTSKLDHFIETFAGPEAESLEIPINGRLERYAHPVRVGAVTTNGSLVSARLHDAPHTIDAPNHYMMVVDSLYSDDPVEIWAASSERVEIGRTSHMDTVITASELVAYGPGLRSVEAIDEAEYDPQEIALQQALFSHSTPQMQYGPGGWRFRTDLESYEIMHDIFTVRRKVAEIRKLPGLFAVQSMVGSPDQSYLPTGSDH